MANINRDTVPYSYVVQRVAAPPLVQTNGGEV